MLLLYAKIYGALDRITCLVSAQALPLNWNDTSQIILVFTLYNLPSRRSPRQSVTESKSSLGVVLNKRLRLKKEQRARMRAKWLFILKTKPGLGSEGRRCLLILSVMKLCGDENKI